MRVLMIQSDSMFPFFSGGSKANMRMMEAFAESGHESFVLFCFTNHNSSDYFLQTLEGLEAEKGIEIDYSFRGRDTIKFRCRKVNYIGVSLESNRMISFVKVHLKLLYPDKICISEMGGEMAAPLFRTLDQMDIGKLIYLPKTIECLPFGPYSVEPDVEITDILIRKAFVLTASQFVADYVNTHAGIDAKPFYFPLYEKKHSIKHNYDRYNKHITLFNGSFWKGLPIFLTCARQLPEYSFLMVRSWGTTELDIASANKLPNVQVCNFDPLVSSIFEKSLCVLVPSIINEAFGQVVIQSMQRGIPVIASNKGGLPEAKLGTDYLLSVPEVGARLSEHERKFVDFEFSASLWSEAIRQLCSNENEWNRVSKQSYTAANRFIDNIKWEPILNAITDVD